MGERTTILVILDELGLEFCHCGDELSGEAPSAMMPVETLRDVHETARLGGYSINYVLGRNLPSHDILKEMHSNVGVVCGYELRTKFPEAVLVLDGLELDRIAEMPCETKHNFIIRASLDELPLIVNSWKNLENSANHVSLILKQAARLKSRDLQKYQEFLESISRFTTLQDHSTSTSFLTDRLRLDIPNHCNAGISHISFAPDGFFYLCPGDYAIGTSPFASIDAARSSNAASRSSLAKSPICRNCDCHQCRRCTYLNRKATGELGIPGHLQCNIAHAEREAGVLLYRSEMGDSASQNSFFTTLPYSDPLTFMRRRKTTVDQSQKAEP